MYGYVFVGLVLIVGCSSQRHATPPFELHSKILDFSNRSNGCPLSNSTVFAVYADVNGGVGNGSSHWESHFWSWWQEHDDRVVWTTLAKEHLNGDSACDLTAYDKLRMYVMPGGDAYDEELAIGRDGRDRISRFVDSRPSRKYMGTCAGWYYSTSSFWWEDKLYDNATEPALLGRFSSIVEGSITDLQDYSKYPCYTVATLDNGLHAVYYGGPTIGWKRTPQGLPEGFKQLIAFSTVKNCPPAGVVSDKLLLWSVHLEAYAGTFDAFEGKPVTIVLDDAYRLQNYKFRANKINQFLNTDFYVPV